MKTILLILFCSLFPLFILCSDNTLAGGGTETTNGISGIILDNSTTGSSMSGLIASVYSIDYRPDSATGLAETTQVSETGAFAFDSLPKGLFNLIVLRDGRVGAFIPSLFPDTVLTDIHLKPTGVITVTVTADTLSLQSSEVIIPGTPFYVDSVTTETVSIRSVPEGTYSLLVRMIDIQNNASQIDFKKTATVDPALQDTAVVVIP